MSLWKGPLIVLAVALVGGGILFIWQSVAKSPVPPPEKTFAPPLATTQTTAPPPAAAPDPNAYSLPPLLQPATPFGAAPSPAPAAPGTPGTPSTAAAPGGTQPGNARTDGSPVQLSDAQKQQIAAIDDEARKRADAIGKDAKLSEADKRASIFVIGQQAQLKALDVLTPAQIERYHAGRQAPLAKLLHLTPAQLTRLRGISDDANRKARAILANASLPDRDKAAQLEKTIDDSTRQNLAVLTPAQRRILDSAQKKEQAQAAPPQGGEDTGPTAKDLHLTDDQQREIGQVQAAAQQKVVALLKDKTLPDQEKQARLAKVKAEYLDAVNGILTPEQRKMRDNWKKK